MCFWCIKRLHFVTFCLGKSHFSSERGAISLARTSQSSAYSTQYNNPFRYPHRDPQWASQEKYFVGVVVYHHQTIKAGLMLPDFAIFHDIQAWSYEFWRSKYPKRRKRQDRLRSSGPNRCSILANETVAWLQKEAHTSFSQWPNSFHYSVPSRNLSPSENNVRFRDLFFMNWFILRVFVPETFAEINDKELHENADRVQEID